MSAPEPRADEQIVWSLARRVRPGDVAVVGVATPVALAALLVARELLVPDLTIITAATVDPVTHDIALPMVQPEILDTLGIGTLSQSEILDQIQRGRITLQFISPAQVDGMGRLNTSRVPAGDGGLRRLPGGLATGDIAVLMGRLVAYRADHSARFLPDRVAFVTGAGHDGGVDWRRERGLPGSGVTAVVTDRAVLAWADDQGGFRLESVHAGHEAAEVTAATGFPVLASGHVETTEAPPAEALALLRSQIDPHGITRIEVRATRHDALAALEALRP